MPFGDDILARPARVGIDCAAVVAGGDAPKPARPIPLAVIIEAVCRALDVNLADYRSDCRHHRVVLARRMTVYLARRLTVLSFPEIARGMARPNHSTVIDQHADLLGQLRRGEFVRIADDHVELHSLCASIEDSIKGSNR